MLRTIAVLLLSVGLAQAQVTTRPPGSAGGTAFDGGTITAPVLGPVGCTDPAYSFTGAPTVGVCSAAGTSATMQSGTAVPLSEVTVGSSSGFLRFSDASGNFTTFVVRDNEVEATNESGQGFTLGSTSFATTLPFLAASGSAAAPSIAFDDDTGDNTGFYWIGEDQLGLTTGGTLRQTFSTTALTSTLPFLAPSGTAAAPAYSFSGGTNAGFYFNGLGIPGVANSGVPVMSLGVAMKMRSDASVNWISTTGDVAAVLSDTGLARSAAAVVKVTNGSTGAGSLLTADGTATAPGYGFSGVGSMGMYRDSTFLKLTAGGGAGIGALIDAGGVVYASTALSPSWNGDALIVRDAANTIAFRNSVAAQKFNIYNTFTTFGTNYNSFSISATATGTDLIGSGAGATAIAGGGFRSIQGSMSKTVVDNTATAFVRLAVADDDYEGCGIIYTAYAEDTATDARQTRTGKTYAAILNNSGTETAVFSTGDSAVAVTAGTFTCTFDATSAVADTIDLRATCDTSLAATTTLTFEYRLDCPSNVTVTPQ
jgi:hypothetical protein